MEKAIKLIKDFEGLNLQAYKCPAGVWTIGWGHTAGVTPGMCITEHEADRLLREDVGAIWRRVLMLPVNLTLNQRRAITSFIYNVGWGNFNRSTLRKRLMANPNDARIAEEFNRWTHGGGRRLRGLVRRRTAEARLYFAG